MRYGNVAVWAEALMDGLIFNLNIQTEEKVKPT
jgi:hypothetical protein